MPQRTIAVYMYLEGQRIQVPLDEIVQMDVLPYPVIAIRRGEKFHVFRNIPIETIDEVTSIEVSPGVGRS